MLLVLFTFVVDVRVLMLMLICECYSSGGMRFDCVVSVQRPALLLLFVALYSKQITKNNSTAWTESEVIWYLSGHCPVNKKFCSFKIILLCVRAQMT